MNKIFGLIYLYDKHTNNNIFTLVVDTNKFIIPTDLQTYRPDPRNFLKKNKKYNATIYYYSTKYTNYNIKKIKYKKIIFKKL